eukprot:11558529-Alexandrium_andersonii.AAC.1
MYMCDVVPRFLADDLILHSFGEDRRSILGANKSICAFYGRMGMVVQVRKCCASANTRGGRMFLRRAHAGQEESAFKVVQAMRDLGRSPAQLFEGVGNWFAGREVQESHDHCQGPCQVACSPPCCVQHHPWQGPSHRP